MATKTFKFFYVENEINFYVFYGIKMSQKNIIDQMWNEYIKNKGGKIFDE